MWFFFLFFSLFSLQSSLFTITSVGRAALPPPTELVDCPSKIGEPGFVYLCHCHVRIDAPSICHPEGRAKPGVEGSSRRFGCTYPISVKILRLASLAQDNIYGTAVRLSFIVVGTARDNCEERSDAPQGGCSKLTCASIGHGRRGQCHTPYSFPDCTFVENQTKQWTTVPLAWYNNPK